MNNRVRRITDGAMMTALMGVLLLIDRQSGGFFEEFLLFVFPLPMVYYSAKYGMKDSWVVFAAVSLLSFVLGTPQMLFYASGEAFAGLVYGSGIHSGKNSRTLLGLSVLIHVAMMIFTTMIYARFFGYDLEMEAAEYEQIITQSMAQAGMAMTVDANFSQLVRTIVLVSVVVTGILQGYITHILSRLLLKRLNIALPPSRALAEIYPPVWTGYPGMACLVAYFYTAYHPLADQSLNAVLQGIGLCGTLYLYAFGALAVMLVVRMAFPGSRLMAVLAVFMIFMMMMPLAFAGFLYITTSWHQRLLEGGAHADKNE